MKLQRHRADFEYLCTLC